MRYVVGMHGLGDNVHQRAIIRQLLGREDRVLLETPWPCIYHDLVGPKLSLVKKQSLLRTQNKNIVREHSKYSYDPPLRQSPDIVIRVSYRPDAVRKYGSILRAMLACSNMEVDQYDFRLPIPKQWLARADALLAQWQPKKPLLIYRPLVERREWTGCAARNPDFKAYAELYNFMRNQFFVLSIADLVPRVEWMVGTPVQVDVCRHRGELDVELLAALTHRAALVYGSSGFIIPMAQAVGTPSVCVFGGYESGVSYTLGARWAPHLAIDPIKPCQCYQHHHNCDKRIDMDKAYLMLEEFLDDFVT